MGCESDIDDKRDDADTRGEMTRTIEAKSKELALRKAVVEAKGSSIAGSPVAVALKAINNST